MNSLAQTATEQTIPLPTIFVGTGFMFLIAGLGTIFTSNGKIPRISAGIFLVALGVGIGAAGLFQK